MEKAYSKFTIKSANAETGEIVGYASTPELDRERDVLEPAGAKFALPVPLLFAHSHDQPVGAVTSATVTPEGIRVVAKLALDASERVREVWALIKAGALRGLSVGFLPLAREPIPGGGFRFTSWDWHELSIVAVPANAGATITNIKSYSAQPVSELRINHTEEKAMTIHERTITAERVTAGACLPWIVRAKAYGVRHGSPLEQSLNALGAPEEVVRRIKAAVGAATTSTAADLAGSSNVVTAFLDGLTDQSILARLFNENAAQKVPTRTRLVGLNSDIDASVVDEGKPIPARSIDLSGQTLDPFKIAAITVLSDELWANTSREGQAFVISKIREAVAKAADRELFNKLISSGTPEIVDTIDNIASPVAGSIVQLLDAVHTRPGSRLHWAVTPSAANALAVTGADRDMNPFSGRMLGLPATITQGLEGRRVALIDGRAVGGGIEGVRIEASNRGAIEMLDNPTNDPLTPTVTSLVSMFQTFTTAIRINMEMALEPIRDNPLAILEIEEFGS